MKLTSALFALCAFALTFSQNAEAARLLGMATLLPGQDIPAFTGSCPSQSNRVSHIRIRVDGDNAHIENLVVKFGNEAAKPYPVRPEFNNGTPSRWIELMPNGGERCIEKIVVRGYSKTGLFATVKIFGADAGEVDSHEDDFNDDITFGRAREVMLAQTVLGNSGTIDVDPVFNCELGRKLIAAKVEVTNDGARNLAVIIRYRGGDVERLPVRADYVRNSESRWVPAQRGERCIQSITIKGVSNRQTNRRAVVTIKGLRVRN